MSAFLRMFATKSLPTLLRLRTKSRTFRLIRALNTENADRARRFRCWCIPICVELLRWPWGEEVGGGEGGLALLKRLSRSAAALSGRTRFGNLGVIIMGRKCVAKSDVSRNMFRANGRASLVSCGSLFYKGGDSWLSLLAFPPLFCRAWLHFFL